jgi:hypothetical protein
MKVAEFGGWRNQHTKLVEFVNTNAIKQEDIVKITYASDNVLFLFYYSEE